MAGENELTLVVIIVDSLNRLVERKDVKETYGRGSRMHGRRTGRADRSYEIRWRERDTEEAEKRNV